MPQVHFIGLDVHKKKIAVAIAEEGRNGEVLSYGSIDNTKAALAKLLQKLGEENATLHLCYEASGICSFPQPWRHKSIDENCAFVDRH